MRIETDSPTLEFYIWSSIQQKIMVPTSMEFLAKNKKKSYSFEEMIGILRCLQTE
jgi:hypothetical protein